LKVRVVSEFSKILFFVFFWLIFDITSHDISSSIVNLVQVI